MLKLKIWMLSFLEEANDRFFDKENTYFEAVNNQEECFGGHENTCFMVFLNNILMTLSHIVFNIPLDLIYDQCYPLNPKTTSFCFTFTVVLSIQSFLIIEDFLPLET